MSDTAPRNPSAAAQMLADALLRSVGGSMAQLRMTAASTDSAMSEVGLLANNFAEVTISPVAMRKLRPTWNEGGESKWELLVSASSVEKQVGALDLTSAQAFFAITMAVTVAGKDFMIESVAANEVFGWVYLYRLLLREAERQAI